MYTTVKLKCVDQTLQPVSLPKLASGGRKSVRVEFTFDSLWNGFGKTAIFYRNKNSVHHEVLTDDACRAPWHMIFDPGVVYVGVYGSSGGVVRTSEVLALTIEQGAITGASAMEPTPDVYQQVLAAYGEAERAIAVERARIDNFVSGDPADNTEVQDIRIGADGETYETAGEAVREQASVAYALRTLVPITYTIGSITNGAEEPNATRARFLNRIKACKAVVNIAENADYYFGYAVYNESGVYDGVDHGWNAMGNNRLTFDSGYFSFNFRRVDNTAITEADLKVISSCVTVEQINIFTAIETAERYAVEGLPIVSPYSLEVGTLADGASQANANRCRFVDKVAVTDKTVASFESLTDYLYGYAVYDETGAYDGVDHGWNTMYNVPPVKFSRAGYVRFNFRRIDEAAISDVDLIALSNAVTLETSMNVLDAMADTERRFTALEQDKKDALASINIEYGRTNGASYVFVRVPKTTNAGKSLRPSLRLTSANGNIDGDKISALTYAREHGAIFTINAGLFNTSTLQPVGQTIIDGVSVTNTPMTDDMGAAISDAECYPLCIDGNGDLSAPYTREVDTADMITAGVIHAVTGWGKVVENFAACPDTVENEIVHAGKYIRQVIGQFQNGDYFVCTVDMARGAIQNEAGITYSELADFLIGKGVKFAYSLDGGGSAETVIGLRQLNPIDEGSAGRAVPTVITFKAM